MSKPTVWRWWDRFLVEGVGGLLYDIPPRRVRKPHRVRTFKASRDPGFELKVRDVVGLHDNPPDHAVVISADEKTRIQALGRTQVPLPMRPGHPEICTQDDKRNGTTCLMAALDVATGKVTGRMVARHRSEEFLAFLEFVSEGIEPGTPVHVILDNVSPHKSAEANEWLKDNANWTFHFTPTSASSMNAVESFFSTLAWQRFKHAIFDSLDGCIAAIEGYIEHHNTDDARPFRWSKAPEDLVEAWKK